MIWIVVIICAASTREILKGMQLILQGKIDNRTVRVNAISKYVAKSYVESSGKLKNQLKSLILISTRLFVFLLWSGLINVYLGMSPIFFWILGGILLILLLQPLIARSLIKNNKTNELKN